MNHKRLIALIIALNVLLSGALQGAVLVEFTFQSDAGTPAPKAPTTAFPGLTVSDITLNGLNEDSSRDDVLAFTAAGSSPTDFFSFTMTTPLSIDFDDSGSLGQLSFDLRLFNGSSDVAENFVRVEVIAGSNSHTFADVGIQNTSVNLDLSGKSLSGVPEVTFNFFVARGATWNDAGIDNIQVQGIASIPEPSTYTALFAGALLLALVARRRLR